jgi:flavoprotein
LEEIAMAKAFRAKGRILAGLLVVLPVVFSLSASAQETPDQFNAANAENQRFYEAQNKLRNQAHDLRNDRARGLLQCQGAGSGAAQNACANNLDIDLRQRGLDLNNQRIQEQNNHSLILKGIGVHRVP